MNKILFFLVCISISLNMKAQHSDFTFCEDFQSGDFKEGYRNKEITQNNGYRIDTTSNDGRFSDNYLITYTRKTGSYGSPKRSEYGFSLSDKIGQNKYFAFSFRIPKSLKFDKANLGREIMICQWHSKPGPGKDWEHYKKFNPFNRPSIALYVTTNDNDNFYLVLRYGNNGKNDFKHKGEVWSTIAVREMQKGKWYDMAFEIKWSFTNSGYIASWVNNEPFTPFNGLHNYIYGANMHNKSPAYFKFGQYRYWDDSNTHEVHFDELRVGNSLKKVSLYSELPEMFKQSKSLDFIKNHK